MLDLTITVHEIASDGLPDFDARPELKDCTAFLYQGGIISGTPATQLTDKADVWQAARPLGGRNYHFLYSGVTHWVELPPPNAMIGAAPVKPALLAAMHAAALFGVCFARPSAAPA